MTSSEYITSAFKAVLNDKIARVSKEEWKHFFQLGSAARGKKASEVVLEPGQLPYHSEAERTIAIRQWLNDRELVQPFEWSAWKEGRELSSAAPGTLAQQPPVTLFALLIAIIRNDRFCDGAWAGAVGSGLVSDIIEAIEQQL